MSQIKQNIGFNKPNSDGLVDMFIPLPNPMTGSIMGKRKHILDFGVHCPFNSSGYSDPDLYCVLLWSIVNDNVNL